MMPQRRGTSQVVYTEDQTGGSLRMNAVAAASDVDYRRYNHPLLFRYDRLPSEISGLFEPVDIIDYNVGWQIWIT